MTTLTRRIAITTALVTIAQLTIVPASTAQRGAKSTEGTEHYAQDYYFTSDWFLSNIPTWTAALEPFKGKPNVSYLEVGLYEGRSAIWMLEQVLTDPSARLTGIDPFDAPGLRELWEENLDKSGATEKTTTIQDYSYGALRALPLESFDIIYIDGSHMAHDVFADAALAYGLLKPGGLMIFDDYALIDEWPAEIRPGLAIDSFLTTYRNYLELVHKDYQVIVRKAGSACPQRRDCFRIGEHVYSWKTNKLFDSSREQVKLNPDEFGYVREMIMNRPFGSFAYEPSAELRAKPGFAELCERLGWTDL